MTTAERAGSDEEVRAALIRHGYNPDALACGLAALPGMEGKTWMSGHAKPEDKVLLRYRVCVLDGIVIDGHEGSDLDPGGGCIHCRKEWDEIDRED